MPECCRGTKGCSLDQSQVGRVSFPSGEWGGVWVKAGIARGRVGGRHVSSRQRPQDPTHCLQRLMLLKHRRLLLLCLVEALRLVCLLPGQVSAGSQWVGRGGAAPRSGGLEGGRAAQTPGFPRAWALSAVTGSGAEVRVQVLNYCSAPDNT